MVIDVQSTLVPRVVYDNCGMVSGKSSPAKTLDGRFLTHIRRQTRRGEGVAAIA